jgi:hypothetical protein
MKIFLKKIKDALINIYKNNKQNKRSILDNINSFLIFSFYSYKIFRPHSKKLTEEININSKLITSNEKFNNVYNKLNLDGHTNLLNMQEDLSDELLDEIISNQENLYQKKNIFEKLYKQNETTKEYLNRLKKKKLKILKFSTNSRVSPSLKKIFEDKFVDKLLYLYLNTKKIYTRNEAFITFENENNDYHNLSKSNQQFHVDMMSKKWLKLFIYLNDVSEENGAHCFIKKSHIKKKKEEFNLPRYFSDNEIMNYYNESEISRIAGKKNTCFFEDTHGLHKAGFVKKGIRIIFAITFSASRNYFHHKNDEVIYLK